MPLVLFLAVAAVAGLQLATFHLDGDEVTRTLRAAVPALAAAGVVLLARMTGGSGGPVGRCWLLGVAAAEVLLGAWAVQAFVRALLAVGAEPSSFYRVKVLVTTPLGDHNTAAGLLLVGVVATVVLAADDRRWWAGVAVTGAGMVACLSRGAAVVLVVVALASWLVGTRRRVAVGLAAVAVVVLAAVVAFAALLGSAPPTADDGTPVSTATGPVGASVVARADLVARGIEVALDRPVLGVGLGAFGDVAEDLPPPNHHAHNAVAHAAAEGGLPLLAVVVALTVVLLVRAARLPRGWRREAALLGGAALVVHSQIDILAGLLGTEVLLAALLVLVTPPGADRTAARPRVRDDGDAVG